MYDPNYMLSDLEILAKYGLKPYSNQEELSLQVTLLYCLKNGYSLHLNEDVDRQVSTLLELKNVLPYDLVKVLNICMLRPHRFYDPEIAMSVYNASRKNNLFYASEYTQVLVALIQTSEPFLMHGCYDYRQTLFLADILKDESCGIVEYDEEKYPFLRVLLPSKVSFSSYHKMDTYDRDHLYRFLISEISDTEGVYPPTKEEWADPIISEFYDSDGMLYSAEEYMENNCGGYFECPDAEEVDGAEEENQYEWGNNILIFDASEFNQTFFRFLDRYESYDCILIPYSQNWQNTSAKDREIRSCIKERMLSEVISDGKDTYILLQGWGDDMVRFKSYCDGEIVDFPNIPSGEAGVTYERILEHGCSLNPYLYIEPQCEDEYKVVQLGEICDLDVECFYEFLQASKSFVLLPDYFYSRDLGDVFRNAETTRQYGVYASLIHAADRQIYSGPHIHITEESEIILNNRTGYYLCPSKKNWALSVKDSKVSIEYLAYVLLNSDGFREFLLTDPSKEIFLKRKVAILKDYKKQEEAVAEFKAQNLAVVNSTNIYNVALLVPDCPDCVKVSMEECWYLKIEEFDHIKGEGGLLDVMDRGLASYDAIIVDAVVDSVRDRYKGLRDLLSRYRGSDIPVYLYSDVEEELLQDDLSEEEFQYVTQGRLFRRMEGISIDSLVRNLRSELDGEDNQTAKIRGQYVREFEAANWLDVKFPDLSIPSDLEFCLSNPSEAFPKVRAMLNGLYEAIMCEISNGSGLDKFKNRGILPSLLRDGKFVDKDQTAFFVRGSVMPLPLAISLRFASDIANGELHTENNKMDIRGYHRLVMSDNLSHAVIRILMDFILWLREVNFEFEGSCEYRDPNVLEKVNWKGILKKAGPKEFYCEFEDKAPVRILVDLNKLEKICAEKVGKEITINKVSIDTQMSERYTWKADKKDWE